MVLHDLKYCGTIQIILKIKNIFSSKFFADWIKAGKPIDPEDLFKFTTDRSKRMLIDTQLDVIGAFVVPTAIILHNIHRPIEEVTRVTQELYR